MGGEHGDRLIELFAQAVELPAGERDGFLDSECDGDDELRRRIEQLLQHDADQDPAFLSPIVRLPEDGESGFQPGDTIGGRFTLRETLGEGGMGVVYLAEQHEPIRRDVALKVIKLGMDTKRVMGRFEIERQVLATLNHPNVAKVFEAGITADGRPFFAMEYADGAPVTGYCDDHRLTVRQRLSLFLGVCGAIQHAHQNGVIHRDIKPSNVLVEHRGGEPLPKVIDFGIAKAVDDRHSWSSVHTAGEPMLGTPEYMSPEQAMSEGSVDTRTDVYSLGLLLYELLAGAPAHDGRTLRKMPFDELCRTIREEDPQLPSTRVHGLSADQSGPIVQRRRTSRSAIVRELRGDLDWITMRAMEKDPERRYQSVSDLAADIRRHLEDQPVEAGPPGRMYRFRKFARRHRAAVIGAAAVSVAVVGGLVASSILAVGQARALAAVTAAQAAEAEQRRVTQAINDFLNDDLLSRASPYEEPDRDITLRAVLDQTAATIEGRFAEEPLVEAGIRTTLGSTYQALGEYESAWEQFDGALALRLAVLAPDHEDVLMNTRDLGTLDRLQGRFEAAEETLTKAVEDSERALGTEHPVTLACRAALAWVHNDLARLDDAAALFEDAIEVSRRVNGPEHPSTIRMMSGLARVYGNQSRYELASSLLGEIHEARRVALGPEHPATVTTLGLMASQYQALGDLGRAEEILVDVVRLRSEVLGAEHPHTIGSEHDLGVLYMMQGRYEDAERQFQAALDVRTRLLGDDHLDTIRATNELGVLLRHQGEYAAAEPLLVRALDVRSRSLGDEHPDTLRTLNELAALYWGIEAYDKAELLLDRTVRSYERVLGVDHPFTLLTRNNLAVLYRNQQRFDDAIELHRATIETALAVLPADHWNIGAFRCDFGITLSDSGDHAAAETELLAAHAHLLASLGEEHPQVTKATEYLARLYEAWHEADPDGGHGDKASTWRGRVPVPAEGADR